MANRIAFILMGLSFRNEHLWYRVPTIIGLLDCEANNLNG
jgi:hypothetical protein